MNPSPPNFAEQTHPECLLCGKHNPIGLHLEFDEISPGHVVAGVRVPSRFQGYRGTVHGGIIASLLDSAMVHCLLKAGVPAVTGDLHVRYRRPVPVERTLELQAEIIRQKLWVYDMEATLRMDGEEVAKASARFMNPGQPGCHYDGGFSSGSSVR